MLSRSCRGLVARRGVVRLAAPPTRALSDLNPFKRFIKPGEEESMRGKAIYYGSVALVGGGVAIVGYSLMHVTSSIMNLSITTILKIGFMTGLGTAGVVGGAVMAAHRAATIRPEAVYKGAYKRLLANPVVEQSLGGIKSSGKLRAYKIDGGYFGTKDGVFGWQEPRVQMLFQLQGSLRDGIATVEARKSGLALRYDLVALDTMDGDGLHIIEGSEQRLHVVGQLRGFLQTERAKYIAQDVLEDVEDELEDAEQEVEREAGMAREDGGSRREAAE